MRKETDIQQLVDTAVERFGKIDCVINNVYEPVMLVSLSEGRMLLTHV